MTGGHPATSMEQDGEGKATMNRKHGVVLPLGMRLRVAGLYKSGYAHYPTVLYDPA